MINRTFLSDHFYFNSFFRDIANWYTTVTRIRIVQHGRRIDLVHSILRLTFHHAFILVDSIPYFFCGSA